MSDIKYTDDELLELGIKHVTGKGRGQKITDIYVYNCARCGRPVSKFCVLLSTPVYCGICKGDALKKKKLAEKVAKENEYKFAGIEDPQKMKRFEKAQKTIEKLGGNYDRAIAAARRAYLKFGSVPEAIAAIMLLNCNIRIIPQKKVSDYNVDFALPDKKIVVEIDGSIYHQNYEKQEYRDDSIKYNLGNDWEVIHVPAESITKNPKMFEQLMRIKCG